MIKVISIPEMKLLQINGRTDGQWDKTKFIGPWQIRESKNELLLDVNSMILSKFSCETSLMELFRKIVKGL